MSRRNKKHKQPRIPTEKPHFMRLASIKPEITQNSTVPGLLDGSITYKVQQATSAIKWTGPRIMPDVWQSILAYFKWTWDTHKSESQVRLYVNVTAGQWAAWAFPQEMGGMAATKELPDDKEWEAQRAQFKESEGWIYLGTVHHHCNMSAFQSGTDKTNETNQDGLHITVGKMDEARHDIHCRFYLHGNEFSPDMQDFWDIGEVARAITAPETWDLNARWQMTCPPPAAVGFPDVWKANTKEEVKTGWQGWTGSAYSGIGGWRSDEKKAQDAALEVVRECNKLGIDEEELAFVLELTDERAFPLITRAAAGNQISTLDVIEELDKILTIAEQGITQLAPGKTGTELESPEEIADRVLSEQARNRGEQVDGFTPSAENNYGFGID